MMRNHHSVTILNVIFIIVAYCAINSLLLLCYPIILSLTSSSPPSATKVAGAAAHAADGHQQPLVTRTASAYNHFGWLAVEAASAVPMVSLAQNPTTSPQQAFNINSNNNNNTPIVGGGGSGSGLTVGAINSQLSQSSSHHPMLQQLVGKSKYLSQVACEDRQLQIECDEGTRINLIRANFGRFSISTCNEQGQLDWSTDCMSPISFRIMQERCDMHRSCSVNASSSIFGDKCPKTRKYLEVHYQCQDIPQMPFNNKDINNNLLQIVPPPQMHQQAPTPEADPWLRPDPTVNPPNQAPIRPSATSQSSPPLPSSHYYPKDIYQPQPIDDSDQDTITRSHVHHNYNNNNNNNEMIRGDKFYSPDKAATFNLQHQQQKNLPDQPSDSGDIHSPVYLEGLYMNLRLPIAAPIDPSIWSINGSEPTPYPFDTQLTAIGNNNKQHSATGSMTFFNSEVMPPSMMGLKDKPLMLSGPEQITIRHHSIENISNPRCVLWDQQAKVWTTRGCELVETNATHTSCSCDKLSVYVVVVDGTITSKDQQRNGTFINSEPEYLPMIDRPIILSEPVLITMRHLQHENVSSPRCVLWDLMRKEWTGNGCKLIETNSTHTSCSCDQLTYYAVLMDLNISATMPLPYLSHDPLWRMITFCSFIITSICLSVTLITLFFMVRQQRRLANQRKQQRNNNYYYGASSYYQQQQKLSSASTSNNNTIYAPQHRVDSHIISKQQEQSDYGQHQQKNMQQKTSYTVISNYNNTSTSLVDDFMSSIPAINNANASLFDNSACLINGNNNMSSQTTLHKNNNNSEIGMIIYKNLCLTILVVEFLYLVTVNHYSHHKLYCHVVSRVLHFALMATFMWCLIEAHELHKNLKSFLKSTTAINNHYKHSHHHHRTNQQANKLTSLLSNQQHQSNPANPCLVVSNNQSHDINLMQHMLQLQQTTDSSSVGSPTSQDTNATIAATLPPLINNTTAGPIPLIRNVINCNSPTSDIQQSNAYWMNKSDISHYDELEVSSWTATRSKYMHLIAYAIPCVVVCITSFVTPQVYYHGTFSQSQQPLVNNHCWLAVSSFGSATVFSGQKLMSLVMAPLLLLLVATATYLVICVYYINKHNSHMNGYVGNGSRNLTSGSIATNHMTLTLKKQTDRNKFNQMSVWLKKTILLVLLVALTWTLALPYLIDSNNINASQQYLSIGGLLQQQLLGGGGQSFGKTPNYNSQRSALITIVSTLVFAMANALMGIFIFTSQCLQSNQVRHQYKLVFQSCSLARFFMKLSLTPSSNPTAKYPGNNTPANVHLSGGTSSNQSSYSSGSLSGVGRHPMTNQHTLASVRNSVLSNQQHHLANPFGSGQQQQIAASAAYLNNQIGDAPLDGQNNLIDGGTQSCQLNSLQTHNNTTLSYNPGQITVGLSNGNKLLFQQQQVYGLHQASSNNHYQMNQGSSIVSPMLNAALQVTSNNSQDQQQKGFHITDEQSLASSSDYGCRRLASQQQGLSQQLETNNGTSGSVITNDLSLLLSNGASNQYGDASSQLSIACSNAKQSEVQNIVQQLLIKQKHQQQQSLAASKGLMQEHIYECIDDDNPYIAKLLLPTLYGQLSPDQRARHIATLARQLGLNAAASPSSTQAMGGRAAQQSHHQQQMQMNQLASRILKSTAQQSLINGQSAHQPQQQSQSGQQRHFALPAIVCDNQKTSIICSKSTQQTSIGPHVATAINSNNLQQAHDIMAIYDSSSIGGVSSLNGNTTFSYGRSDKLSTDC